MFEFNSMEGYMLNMQNFTARFNARYETSFSVPAMQKYSKKLKARFGRSYVKPLLKNSHKIRRLRFILSEMEPIGNGDFAFRSFKNVLHCDEKWFYATRTERRYRHFPGDERFPDEQTQHKNAIQKMMFLCVVGVPQHVDGYEPFDGKIGMFPVAERTVAQRNSVNRPAGTELWSPVSMTAEEYLFQFTKEGGVIAKIIEKMPWLQNFVVRIQHDNASPHVGKGNDYYLSVAGGEHGWNIEFFNQPSQSPDLNVLDLCLFHSLQRGADEIRGFGKSLNEIHDSVMQHWQDYTAEKLERAFALVTEIKRCILLHGGDNQFKLPHSHIRRRQNEGVDEVIDLFVPRDTRLRGLEALDRLENGAFNPPGEEDDSDDDDDDDADAEVPEVVEGVEDEDDGW
jgi:hypothetical protein